MQNTESNNSLIVSFLTLRRLIGIFGIALPLIILFYSFLISGCDMLDRSISAYYHTGLHDIFVGILCALGVFMMTYKGYDRKDTFASILAGIFAVSVAFFPTDDHPVCGNNDSIPGFGALHLTAAAGLFLVFAYMSLMLFTKTAGGMTSEKQKRNTVYKICGYVIVGCIALILIHKTAGSFLPEWMNPVFWLEAVSLLAFGISWLVKGETILRDKNSA